MSFLGVVCKIREMDLRINLPDRLTGSLAITEVSAVVSSQLKAYINTNQDFPLLNDMFCIGQFVKVVVIDLEKTNEYKKIVLSMRPEKFNKGLSFNAVGEGSVIYGSVKSKEDKGYIVDLGMSGHSGFLPFSKVSSHLKEKKTENEFFLGQPINCVVSSKTGRTLLLNHEQKLVCKSVTKYHPKITFDSLKAGLLVEATINKILDDGLEMSFLQVFTGVVS